MIKILVVRAGQHKDFLLSHEGLLEAASRARVPQPLLDDRGGYCVEVGTITRFYVESNCLMAEVEMFQEPHITPRSVDLR